MWLGTSVGLLAYVQRLRTSTYASLAGVAISVSGYGSHLLMIGGETVNGEQRAETTRNSNVGPERPLGAVADSIPTYPWEE